MEAMLALPKLRKLTAVGLQYQFVSFLANDAVEASVYVAFNSVLFRAPF